MPRPTPSHPQDLLTLLLSRSTNTMIASSAQATSKWSNIFPMILENYGTPAFASQPAAHKVTLSASLLSSMSPASLRRRLQPNKRGLPLISKPLSKSRKFLLPVLPLTLISVSRLARVGRRVARMRYKAGL